MSTATATDRGQVERLVRAALAKALGAPPSADGAHRPRLVANISTRHCHLTQEHVEALFGQGAQLKPMKFLYQEGEFASEQMVTVIGPRQRIIAGVRVLGPC